MAGEGLSSTGFVSKTLTTIQAEITASLQTSFGPQINLQPGSVFATVRDIFSDRENQLWALAQQVYNSQYPDTATGAQLDNVVALTGTTRLSATFSRSLNQYFFGTAGTLIPAGTLFSVIGNPLAVFALDNPVTLIAGTNEVQTLTFGNTPNAGSFILNFGALSTPAILYSSSAASIQALVQALSGYSGVTVTGSFAAGFVFTFAGVNGLQPYSLITIGSNTLNLTGAATTTTVTETTLGVVQGSGTLTCQTTGAIVAPIGTLTVINTLVTGLTSTNNVSDVVPGRAVETDSALRIRRKSQLQNAGAGTVENIRARLLTISGVTQAIVYENQTSSIDVNLTPSKGIQCFVQGGAVQDIANMIWATKPAAIETGGNISQNITDSQGIIRAMKFSRPVSIPLFITVTITKNASWPSDGVAQVVAALVAYGLTLTIGQTVYISSKLLPIVADAVSGISNIAVTADITASPVNTNPILIAVNSLATISSGNIVVNVT